MPKLGSALGATRGGQKDGIEPGRSGRARGSGAIGGEIQSNRGAVRSRGRGQARGGRNGTSNENAPAFGAPSAISPFAAIKSNTDATSSPFGVPPGSSGFGKPSPKPASNTTNGFGAPSITHEPIGNTVHTALDPRSRPFVSQNRVSKPQLSEQTLTSDNLSTDYQERYEKLKLDRIKKRELAIKQGQMADPTQPTLLNKAITPVGTCTYMCPEFERVERIVQKMVDKAEKSLDPATDKFEIKELKMLKRFRRSAAGYDEQLPSDIRTPNTLLQTMNYLIRHVVSGPDPLGLIHKFVWDRTRSIRNDFSVQQLTKAEDIQIAVKCLERIARFHIISLHLLSSPDNDEQFDHHQEREQLNNTMLSLMHYYDDNREHMLFPNEPEFRAYYIVLAIHDQRPDVEDRVQKWPQEILQNSKVQVALELLAAANNYWEYQVVLDEMRPSAISQGFYDRFFSLVDSPAVSYLMGCVAEIYFNNVRQTAIRSIWKAYCRVPISQQHKNEEWTVSELTRVLYFDDDSQTEDFCEEQGLQLLERSDGELYLNWGTSNIDIVDFAPSSQHSFSQKLVEMKRGGRTLAAIILGLNIKQAATRGMIDVSLLPESEYGTPLDEEDNELFVAQDDSPMDQEEATPFQNPFGDLPKPASELDVPKVPNNGVFGAQPTDSVPAVSIHPPTTTPTVPLEASTGFNSIPSLFSTASTNAQASNTSSPFATAPSKPAFFPNAAPEKTDKPLFSTSSTKEISAPAIISAPNEPAEKSKFGFWSASSRNSAAVPVFADTTSKPTPSSIFGQSHLTKNETVSEAVPRPFDLKSTSTFHLPASTQPPSIGFQVSQDSPTLGPSKPFATKPLGRSIFHSPFSGGSQTISASKTESIFTKPQLQAHAISTSLPAEPKKSFDSETVIHRQDPDPSNLLARNEPTQSTDVKIVSPSPALSTLIPTTEVDKIGKDEDNGIKKTETQIFQQQGSLPEKIAQSSPPPPPQVRPSRSESAVNENTDSRRSWIETLRQSAVENRAAKKNRKRPLEDGTDGTSQIEETQSSISDESQLSLPQEEILPKPKRALRKQKKHSLALASVAPLPTLPILEQVKKSIEVKRPPTKDENASARTSQIDEDEMILSAARIAAEQLKNGPRLLGRNDDYIYGDSLRSSSLMRSSTTDHPLSSSLSSSRSSSSPYARINGYEVALAPETPLGLGRTLSRTEQRLRLTGGKGLAYKPLQSSPPNQKNSNSSKKSLRPRSST